ncbi:hypothetical protein OEA41_004644 [Lepraria neglecta]|uniref:Uncharacterized protein n=1 Tax=Lepraria neglecta TaxID=209136 RepID=A0AAD9Z0E3_9LECA|nr:hypothetical protein OEA41_004644 [Lepraria neglecta]
MSKPPSSYTPENSDRSCDKCGAPASWANYQSLSFDDSLQHHLYTWLNSPQMWPIGYIIRNPYSPLHLECQIPSRNWRDAFEDLIALNSGGQMIGQQSRKKEAEVVAHLHYEDTYKQVSRINELLGREARWASLLQRIRAFGARNKINETISVVDDKAIPQTKADSQQLVEFGQRIIATLKEDERKGWPASRYKLRTQ